MNESTALIARDDSKLEIAFTPAAVQMREGALEAVAMVGKVANPEDQQSAVIAQAEIQKVLSLVEKARKAAKEPVLDFGRKIDDAAKVFRKEMEAELLRVSRLIGDYQMLEGAKARAAEQARNEALSQLERERAAAMASANSHEAQDAIAEVFSNRAAEVAPPPPGPARVDGQVVRQDWEVEITDIWALVRAHPNCVNPVPRMGEIKELLKQGVKVCGVRATPITKSGVRVNSKALAAIDV